MDRSNAAEAQASAALDRATAAVAHVETAAEADFKLPEDTWLHTERLGLLTAADAAIAQLTEGDVAPPTQTEHNATDADAVDERGDARPYLDQTVGLDVVAQAQALRDTAAQAATLAAQAAARAAKAAALSPQAAAQAVGAEGIVRALELPGRIGVLGARVLAATQAYQAAADEHIEDPML